MALRSRAALEREISKYERYIVTMKREINSQIPINQLPPEVLSEILLVWVSQCRKAYKWFSKKTVIRPAAG